MKLVIAANSFRPEWISLSNVDVRGIVGIGQDRLEACRREGSVVKLLATAELVDDGWSFNVQPTPVPATSFLGGCTGWEMGAVIESDLYGTTFHKLYEREPIPTSASMIRDAVHLATMGRAAAS